MRALAFFLFRVAGALAWPAGAREIPGRVAWADDSVALHQDPDPRWDEACVNSPITSENSLQTDPGARAELQVATRRRNARRDARARHGRGAHPALARG